ncbi:MAG: hypothetical protein F6K17_22025 [Okeania sp. SIO3C4]|nr:hypothetical protein [Okeania sp. SIO3B3]NER05076.1 hypothetical protein [Okeania sp. SIO3C4]
MTLCHNQNPVRANGHSPLQKRKNTMIFVTTKELNSQIIPNLSMKAFKSWSQLLPGAKAAEFRHNQGIKFSDNSQFIPGSFQILE